VVNEKEIINDKEVVSIKLECGSELCKKKGDVPFSEKTFEDAKEIKLFVKAINKAEKMNGKLDYGALFIMQVSLKNGTQKKYVLNIDNEAESTGLLVELSNSSQGYTISQGLSDDLRKIIYKH
jgi:hypothetical protein